MHTFITFTLIIRDVHLISEKIVYFLINGNIFYSLQRGNIKFKHGKRFTLNRLWFQSIMVSF
jgi:hypothetical protein